MLYNNSLLVKVYFIHFKEVVYSRRRKLAVSNVGMHARLTNYFIRIL